jgi:ubiquinone/menaquinone biosynthesis C-methylase UbiE
MPTDKKTISNYNKFAEVFKTEKATGFYHLFVEKPAMYKLLPDLKNKNVLCLGVGTGEEANFITKKGGKVIGIDISQGMIGEAKKEFPQIDFRVMDMEKLDFPKESFDLVYSSLAIHHIKDWFSLMKKVNKVLKPGGIFLFSTTHPSYDSRELFMWNDWKIRIFGSARNVKTNKRKVWGKYFADDKQEMDWGDGFITTYYRKSMQSIMHDILKSGFNLIDFVEPRPILKAKKADPDLYFRNIEDPCFAIFKCQKK